MANEEVEGTYNDREWVTASGTAEIVYTVNETRTHDAAIGSPPPLLYFSTLAAPYGAHYIKECRNPCCSPASSHTPNSHPTTADERPISLDDCTIASNSCTCLQLPSSQTADRELRAAVAGRTKMVASDRTRTQPVKRRTKPMKAIDIDPPQLGVVALSPTSLWEFLLELLANPTYEPYIQWRNREHGLFKILNSEVVAALWGKHKHRTNMNFDKMARAMRYYYGKNILDKGANGGRLEYEFRSGSKWKDYVPRSLMHISSKKTDDVVTVNSGNSNMGKRARTKRHNGCLSNHT